MEICIFQSNLALYLELRQSLAELLTFVVHDAMGLFEQGWMGFLCLCWEDLGLIARSLLHFWQARDFEARVSLNESQWLFKALCAPCKLCLAPLSVTERSSINVGLTARNTKGAIIKSRKQRYLSEIQRWNTSSQVNASAIFSWTLLNAWV